MRTVLAAALLMSPLLAQPANDSGDFYIVSSVDLAKRQILLKRPTEVTELMRVDGDTRYFGENGSAIRLTDLRAGDTVYIAVKQTGSQPVAGTIRKGPMTLEVLRDRYLKKTR